jgi:hypothetical protein
VEFGWGGAGEGDDEEVLAGQGGGDGCGGGVVDFLDGDGVGECLCACDPREDGDGVFVG